MARKIPYVAYIAPDRMQKARQGGLKNFSRIADEAIERYVRNAPIIQVT